MQGLMQEMPLTVGGIFRRAETLWPSKQVVTAGPRGLVAHHLRGVGRAHPAARQRPR